MIEFRNLPVYRHREEILRGLSENQTIIVESPTGSGKTTQIPLILKEAGYDRSGIIGITQPRRIAAMSVCGFIKKQIGACDPKTASPEKTMDIRGRDLVQGLPRQVTVSSVDIARAIEEPVNAIVAGIKRVLEKTPPELSADVMDRGIILTGGGAYLRGIAELIMEETEINAMVAESAGECVALGTGIALESLDKLKETGAVYLATRKGIVNK